MIKTEGAFRRAAARLSGATGKRYRAALRAFAVQCVRRQLAEGGSAGDVARRLGVSGQTLAYWLHAARTETFRAVVPVRIAPEARIERSDASVVVRTPEGYQVQVGSVSEAVALVRGLR